MADPDHLVNPNPPPVLAGSRQATPGREAPSSEAVALLQAGELVDLHVDTFIAVRSFGWDVRLRHDRPVFRGRLFGHLDVPRLEAGGLKGAMWSITTNPFRTRAGRWRTFLRNLEGLKALVAASDGRLSIARDLTEYRAARARGALAVLPAIQGGNALDAAPDGALSIPDRLITRITLIHLLSSALGSTSSPTSRVERRPGLTPKGARLVETMNATRVLVDLAHIHPRTFWDVVAIHDRSQPLIVTHTGVCGVRPHWRNLDDAQLRAIADSGGTIGVIFAVDFLARRRGPRDAEMVVEHLDHIVRTVGEDFASIGSDFDGFIIPPPDLRSGLEYVRLVDLMLRRGWSDTRIHKILGGNALRVLGQIRP